jgi:hypothetical protein
MIVDDLRTAVKRHDAAHPRELFMALRHFLAQHRQGLAAPARRGAGATTRSKEGG